MSNKKMLKKSKATYNSPVLKKLGIISKITLKSGGDADSGGGPFMTKPPPSMGGG